MINLLMDHQCFNSLDHIPPYKYMFYSMIMTLFLYYIEIEVHNLP